MRIQSFPQPACTNASRPAVRQPAAEATGGDTFQSNLQTDFIGQAMTKGLLLGVAGAGVTGTVLGITGAFSSHPALSSLAVAGVLIGGSVGGFVWACR